VEWVEGKAETMGRRLGVAQFDYVVCTYVLCTVEDIEAVIRNVKTVLKPVSIVPPRLFLI